MHWRAPTFGIRPFSAPVNVTGFLETRPPRRNGGRGVWRVKSLMQGKTNPGGARPAEAGPGDRLDGKG
jgi:hypothetical protein